MTTTTASPVHRRVEQVMGMPISLALRGRQATGSATDDAWAGVLASLREDDRVFSTHRPDSVISRLARHEIGLDECPAQVREVLDLAERARLESHGAFNVERPGPDGELVLDPSGIVKGWATERAAESLAALTDTDFCLSAGGDMVCRVADPDAPAWRIGIEHPADPRRLIAMIPVRDGAVATSGSAHRGAHIQDPRTGFIPTTLAAATVVAPSLTWADIDATAAVVLGDNALAWMAGRPGRSGVVAWADGRAEIFGRAAQGTGADIQRAPPAILAR